MISCFTEESIISLFLFVKILSTVFSATKSLISRIPLSISISQAEYLPCLVRSSSDAFFIFASIVLHTIAEIGMIATIKSAISHFIKATIVNDTTVPIPEFKILIPKRCMIW